MSFSHFSKLSRGPANVSLIRRPLCGTAASRMAPTLGSVSRDKELSDIGFQPVVSLTVYFPDPSHIFGNGAQFSFRVPVGLRQSIPHFLRHGVLLVSEGRVSAVNGLLRTWPESCFASALGACRCQLDARRKEPNSQNLREEVRHGHGIACPFWSISYTADIPPLRM